MRNSYVEKCVENLAHEFLMILANELYLLKKSINMKK